MAVFSVLACATPLFGLAPCRAEVSGDLVLRDIDGLVERTLSTDLSEGEEWIEAVIDDGSAEPVRVRLAPVHVLERSGFELRAGDPIRVRYFVSEDPPAVQRIRNLRTGALLRLRCLHGEPLWDQHPRRRAQDPSVQ